MKRSLALLLCALTLLSLCACGAGNTPPPANGALPDQRAETAEPDPASTPEPTPAPTPEPTPVPMRTRYVIPEEATSAPEPDPSRYGVIDLDEAEKTLEIIQDARDLGLLREDEKVIFDPNAEFYRGADREEIEYYLDETILVICWKEVVEGCTCSFAEIRIADPSQFRRKLADDTFDSPNRYLSSDMHAQTHAVLSLNADFYQNRDLGLVVYDRKVYRFPQQGYAGGYNYSNCLETCFVNASGEFLFTELGQPATREELEQFVADNDVLFSIAFGPILIRDGQAQECSWYPVGQVTEIYSRAGIGEVDKLHYLYMSLNHAPEKAGSWTVDQFARHFAEKDVRTAYCMDGGQTGEMVFRGRPYNHIDFRVERTVSDNIYFASAIGAEEILEPVPDRAKIRLRPAEELSPLPEHDALLLADGVDAVQLLLSTDRKVSDLRILALSPEEREGELRFEERELYAQPEFGPELPLLLTLRFPGDLPCWGFSYTDPDGTAHRCAVALSGEDGRPIFWEY